MLNYIDILVIKSKNILKIKTILIVYKNKQSLLKSSDSLTEFMIFLKKITEKKGRSAIFFTSNLNFFALNILQKSDLEREGFVINTLILKNTFYHLTLTHVNSKTKIIFKCLLRFFPIGLENLSNKLQDKNTFNKKIYNITEENCFTDESSIEILKNNKNFCYKILNELNATICPFLPNWSWLTYSMAGIALEIFKKHYNNLGINIEQSVSNYNRFKPAYIAGRNEVYGNPTPGEYVYHFDFPNMYGTVMEDEFFFGKWKFLKTNKVEKDGIYHAIVNVNNLKMPVLPVKVPNESGNFYVNGRFEGFFTKDELKLFEECGGEVLRIYEFFCFEKKNKIFASYVKTLQALRKDSKLSNYIFKNLLVSFYGRLGMGILDKKETIVSQESYKAIKNNEEITTETWIGAFGIIQIKESEARTQANLCKELKFMYHTMIEGGVFFQEQGQIVFLNIKFIKIKPKGALPFLSKNEEETFNSLPNLLLNFEGKYRKSSKKKIESFYAKITKTSLHFEINGLLLENEKNLMITITIWRDDFILFEFIFESENFVEGRGEYEQIKWPGIFNQNKKIPSDVILASQVTSKARIKLYKLFLEIEKLGGRILYCHTDSAFVSFKFDIKKTKNTRLLELFGNENAYLKDAVFASTQVYALKYFDNTEVVKISGISTTNVNFDDFKKAFYNNSSLKTKSTITNNVWLLNNSEVECLISMTNYNKREFSKDKSVTRPLYLEDIHLYSDPKF